MAFSRGEEGVGFLLWRADVQKSLICFFVDMQLVVRAAAENRSLGYW